MQYLLEADNILIYGLGAQVSICDNRTVYAGSKHICQNYDIYVHTYMN